MRLADFILRDMESILVQFEEFAGSLLPAAQQLDPDELRDDAQQILEAIAHDLSTIQTREGQAEKSRGLIPRPIGAPATAAQTHALLRARSGFAITQLVAEYRALRASVLRLWTDACQPDETHLEDVMRFNEAIDQALAESIGAFTEQVDRGRNLLLGMLGHDMRSPLQTMEMTASYLSALNAGTDISEAASRLINSGIRMKALLDDLLDFNRTKLGLGINIVPANVDLAVAFAEELDLLRAAHPNQIVELDVVGNSRGCWDGRRLQQLLGNLVLNAIKYGNQGAPVRVSVIGEEAELRFEVRNSGPTIDPAVLKQIIDPLKRGAQQETSSDREGSLGLGLFIAREIVKAHGGEISARGEDTETVFAVRLPRS